MKKLLFVLAFAFIGQQAFSQMYIVVLAQEERYPSAGCNQGEYVLLKVDPSGAESTSCLSRYVSNGFLSQLNQEFNNLISLGYKMMDLQKTPILSYDANDMYFNGVSSNTNYAWYFAIP
tara:strand:+ start:62 stop:418 length:357 start_codon:yes stop_codon:yes gene_type:complete